MGLEISWMDDTLDNHYLKWRLLAGTVGVAAGTLALVFSITTLGIFAGALTVGAILFPSNIYI